MPLFIFIFTLYLIDVFRSHLSVVQAYSAARVTVDDRVLGVLGSEREKDDNIIVEEFTLSVFHCLQMFPQSESVSSVFFILFLVALFIFSPLLVNVCGLFWYTECIYLSKKKNSNSSCSILKVHSVFFQPFIFTAVHNFGVRYIFVYFIEQGCSKLIKIDSKDITKKLQYCLF